jgi:hypothetical protein
MAIFGCPHSQFYTALDDGWSYRLYPAVLSQK